MRYQVVVTSDFHKLVYSSGWIYNLKEAEEDFLKKKQLFSIKDKFCVRLEYWGQVIPFRSRSKLPIQVSY